MRRNRRCVAVITADVIQSTRYSPSERRRLDRVLRKAIAEAGRRFPNSIHTPLAFRVTAGDEFQFVLSDVSCAFGFLMYLRAMCAISGLRPTLRFRASIGVGGISVKRRKNPYEEDGEAFVRSRQGLEAFTESRSQLRWTKIVTGSEELDATAEVVLMLTDHMQRAWTVRQWEAIRWALLDLGREQIARRVKVAHQNVSKRLTAAGWQRFDAASDFLAALLKKSSAP